MKKLFLSLIFIALLSPCFSQTYKIINFTSAGTTSWTPPLGVTKVEVLVVAGGGGGGGVIGGGGGAGGLIHNSSYPVIPGQAITVTVGSGGAGGVGFNYNPQHGTNGGNSVFGALTAIGGGGGAAHGGVDATNGGNGGSGGGGAANRESYGLGTAGQGYNGGDTNRIDNFGGGGGGASEAGGYGASGTGNGGDGLAFDISGSSVYYGGGGGGGVRSGSGAATSGGLGGGGAGTTTSAKAGNGIANTGGGGGGAGYSVTSSSLLGGNGGSGIVIIKYIEPKYVYVNFTAIGTTSWIPPIGVTEIEVLVVAGGGGGTSGGGGAGGLIYNLNFSVIPGTSYGVTVGAGGNGGVANGGSGRSNGGNSAFGTLTAIGGGAGGTNDAASSANLGGSGGGGGSTSTVQTNGGAGISGQGYAGGTVTSTYFSSPYPSSGGGGAGAAGNSPSGATASGNGGIGVFYFDSYFAGGGGGSTWGNGIHGTGGLGGGGSGGYPNGIAGTQNTGGGGGGGAGGGAGTGGAGGSGIVLIKYIEPEYVYVNFTAIGTTSWTPPVGVAEVEVLVVAGGGGGGSSWSGGGGGAGGIVHNLSYSIVPSQSITVTVGAGGNAASKGGNSVFGTSIAEGGGFGSSYATGSGGDGGCGGGATGSSAYQSGGIGSQGFNGGQGYFFGGSRTIGGGGGGMGAVGANWNQGSHGGIGVQYDISGTMTYYAGGGGGGSETSDPAGSGGLGGGGAGRQYGNGYPGTANTGGGGGGSGGSSSYVGGSGGSGIILIRYIINNNPPITQINDTNENWRKTDILFNLTCQAQEGCSSTFYKILQGDAECNASYMNAYSSAVLADCASGSECIKTICYYSNDSLGNNEEIKKQLYKMDKKAPQTTLNDTNSDWRNEDIFSLLICNDTGIGCDKMLYKTLDGDVSCDSSGMIQVPKVFSGNITFQINNSIDEHLYDYPVSVEINTQELISNNKLKNDCSDISIYDNSWNEYYYWVLDCNSEQTTIWINARHLNPLSTHYFLMNYGNNSLTNNVNNEGNLTVTSQIFMDSIKSQASSNANSGASSISVSSASGFSINDEILIIEMKGANAGAYEFNKIKGISGNDLTLFYALRNSYTTAGKSFAQKVPHYDNVSVNSGGEITSSAWDGNLGGIIAFRAKTINVNSGGIINATAKGYSGGVSGVQGAENSTSYVISGGCGGGGGQGGWEGLGGIGGIGSTGYNGASASTGGNAVGSGGNGGCVGSGGGGAGGGYRGYYGGNNNIGALASVYPGGNNGITGTGYSSGGGGTRDGAAGAGGAYPYSGAGIPSYSINKLYLGGGGAAGAGGGGAGGSGDCDCRGGNGGNANGTGGIGGICTQGACGYAGNPGNPGVNGLSGGGIIFMQANLINATGNITANGGAGGSGGSGGNAYVSYAPGGAGGGGAGGAGGSGGSIHIQSNILIVQSNISSAGGAGGAGGSGGTGGTSTCYGGGACTSGSGALGSAGTSGDNGLIRIDYDLLSGSISSSYEISSLPFAFNISEDPSAINITCALGSECIKTICYYSNDSFGNNEEINKQLYKIDKVPLQISGIASTNSSFNSGLSSYINVTLAYNKFAPTKYYFEKSADGITYSQVFESNENNYLDFSAITDNSLYYYRAKANYSYYNSTYNYLIAITADRTAFAQHSLSVTNNINSATITNLMNDSGLILYMPFEENTGTATKDWSINNLTGTLVNSPQWASGKHGFGLEFNGINNYITETGNINLSSKSFSVSVFAKRNYLNGYHMILGQGIAAINQALHFGFRDNNKFTFAFYGNDLDTSAYADNEWHHWAGTYDAETNQRKIYRDGELVANDTASQDYLGTGIFYIGKTSYSTNYFNGTIDEVKIYNRSLTQREIINDMQSGKPYFEIFISNQSEGQYYPEISQSNIYEDLRANDSSAPNAPGAPSITPLSTTSLQINWNAVNDNGNTYYHYSKIFDEAGNYNQTAQSSIQIISGINSYQANGSDATISGWTNSPITSAGLECFTNYSFSIKAKDNAGNIGQHSIASASIYPISFLSGCNGADGFCINNSKCYVPFNCSGFNCINSVCNGAQIEDNKCKSEICNINGYSFSSSEIINGCNCSLAGTCAQGYCLKDSTCNYGVLCQGSGWNASQCSTASQCAGNCSQGLCAYNTFSACSNGGCAFNENNPDLSEAYCTGCGEEWIGSNCCGDDGEESYANSGLNNPCCYKGNNWINYERQDSLLCHNGIMYDCNGAANDGFSEILNTGSNAGELICTNENEWSLDYSPPGTLEAQSKTIVVQSGKSAVQTATATLQNPSADYKTYDLILEYSKGYSHFSETKSSLQTITIPPKSEKVIYMDVYATIAGESFYTLSAQNINDPEEYLLSQFSIIAFAQGFEAQQLPIFSAHEFSIFDLIVSFLNKILLKII